MKLKAQGQKWLKAIHIFFGSLWMGGALCVLLMLFFLKADSDRQLYGINQAVNFVDVWIIIPGNLGLVITGIIYSAFTKWGWFKHKWITVKWIIAVYGMTFGTFWLGPWASSLERIANSEGLNALADPQYASNLNLLYIWGSFQAATIIFASFISALKPWRKSGGVNP